MRVSEGNYNSSKLNIKNSQSGPCAICCERLWEMGFGKVAFTNHNNDVEIHKLINYKQQQRHITSSYRIQINKKGVDISNSDIGSALKHNLRQIRI